MLNQQQCERILAIMVNHSIEEKLKAIEDAKVLFGEAFKPDMTDVQFAYSAMVVEQQYNYIREILQVKQIRIKADLGGHVAKEKAKAEKAPAKKKALASAAVMDPSKFMASFSDFLKSKEIKQVEAPNPNPDSNSTS